jgi:uncharacterized DUF497 family protein
MIVTFDEGKDRSNLAKHGISLARAAEMVRELAFVRPDDRFAYDEDRFVAIAPIGERLFVLVYVDLGERGIRAISLREATKQEARWFKAQW